MYEPMVLGVTSTEGERLFKEIRFIPKNEK
jgi:hypothetical protein